MVLAQNYSAYTLELTPSKIADLAATEAELRKLVDITPRDERQFKRLLTESKNFESIPLKTKLSEEEAARVAAQAWRFPGVEVKARLFRDYPFKEMTSHVLGYIGRINQRDKERLEEEEKTANYKGSNYIGKTGLEAVYEDDLHGKVGFEEVETDSGGRAVRSLRRTPPVNGNTLKLALDIRLQEMADKLFGSRRGALVAIEPSTGGVLAFLSAGLRSQSVHRRHRHPDLEQSEQRLAEADDQPRCAAPIRPAPPSSPSWRWPHWKTTPSACATSARRPATSPCPAPATSSATARRPATA